MTEAPEDTKFNNAKAEDGPPGPDPSEFKLEVQEFDYNYHRTGPRTKCTPELIEEIATRIAYQGSSYMDACKLAGIHEATFYDWLRRGRVERARLHKLGVEVKGDGADKALPEELPYLTFFEMVEKAVPARKALLVGRIAEAGKDPRNWTANAWLLERMHPDEFGRKTRLEIKQIDWREEVVDAIKQGAEFDIVVEKIGERQARELFERARVEVPGDGASGGVDGED